MKPIEPGCLVLLWRAIPAYEHDIGKVSVVIRRTQYPPDFTGRCYFCGSREPWLHRDQEGLAVVCGCCLIRIDDDPDAMTEPTEQEVTCNA